MSPRPADSIRSAGAFTIVELLAVLAIVAILAAVLIPVIGNVRKEADLTETVSRLRMIGQATSLYVQDHGGKLPESDQPSGGRWPFAVAPYIEAIDDKGSVELYSNLILRDTTQEYLAGKGRGVFGYNLFFTGMIADQNWRRMNSIINPAGLPLFATTNGDEGGGLHLSYQGPHPSATNYGYGGPTDTRGPAPNHDGRTVYLMADFHTRVADDPWPWSDHIGSDFHPKGDPTISAP